MTEPEIDIPALIDEGAELKGQMAAAKTRLDEINVALARSLPPGDHFGYSGAKCKIVGPCEQIKVDDESATQLKKMLGDAFGSLFTRSVTFKPVKAFREVAAAVLTPAKLRKTLALVEKPQAGYVKW